MKYQNDFYYFFCFSCFSLVAIVIRRFGSIIAISTRHPKVVPATCSSTRTGKQPSSKYYYWMNDQPFHFRQTDFPHCRYVKNERKIVVEEKQAKMSKSFDRLLNFCAERNMNWDFIEWYGICALWFPPPLFQPNNFLPCHCHAIIPNGMFSKGLINWFLNRFTQAWWQFVFIETLRRRHPWPFFLLSNFPAASYFIFSPPSFLIPNVDIPLDGRGFIRI